MSFSTWSRYKKCEAEALANDRGEIEFETTLPMLESKYIEALLIGTEEEIEELFEEHPEILNSRTGEPKVGFQRAGQAAEKAKEDPFFMVMLEGSLQERLEGEINGVKVIGYADVIKHGSHIVDLKAVANFDRMWDPSIRQRVSFIEMRDYDVQGYIYKELYRQMHGDDLSFYLAALTKEEYSQRVIASFSEDTLYAAELKFKGLLPRIVALRKGEQQPEWCGKCDYCKQNMPTLLLDSRFVGMSTQEKEDFERYLEERNEM